MCQNHYFRENKITVFDRGLALLEKGRSLEALSQFRLITANSGAYDDFLNLDFYVGPENYCFENSTRRLRIYKKRLTFSPTGPMLGFIGQSASIILGNSLKVFCVSWK